MMMKMLLPCSLSLLGLRCRLPRVLQVCSLLAILAEHFLAEARLLDILVGGSARVEVAVLCFLGDEVLEVLLHLLLLGLGGETVADRKERGVPAAKARLAGRRRLVAEV